MIKFFRKIRQKLLVENRFNKYILYATGEIILVVIGILIALQINNWNEDRKDVLKAKNLKEKLIVEIEETINYFEFTEKGMLDQISYLKNFLNVENFHTDSLMTKRRFGVNPLFYMSSFSQFFDPPSDIYETAKNDGSIRLLRDKKLLRLLQKFHQSYKQRINQLIEEEYASGRKINDYLSESYGDFFKVKLWDEKDNLNQEPIKNIVLKVRQDGSLRYKLIERIEMKKVRYRFLRLYKERFQNLLKRYQ